MSAILSVPVYLGLLALLAAVPGGNVLVLGYLLGIQGEMARSGSPSEAFRHRRIALRLAAILIGVACCLVPLLFLGGLAADAHLVHAGSPADRRWHSLLTIVSVLMWAHLCLALAAGGRLSNFCRPFSNLRQLRARPLSDDLTRRVLQALEILEIRRHLWLGIRGFAGTFLWLLLPTLLFAAGDDQHPPPKLIVLLGGIGLMLFLSWIPFLQAHFTLESRMTAFTQLGTVRALFRRAPWAFTMAVVVTLGLTFPLYILKILVPPEDGLWLITPLFIMALTPGKVLVGWAYHRAKRRDGDRGWAARLSARLVLFMFMAAYVYALFFTRFLDAHGRGVLFEHHAFLLVLR
jgi:hypothetical protein